MCTNACARMHVHECMCTNACARMHVRECMCTNACARALLVASMLADSLKDSAWQLHGSLAVQLPSAVAAAKLLLAYLWQRCCALKCGRAPAISYVLACASYYKLVSTYDTNACLRVHTCGCAVCTRRGREPSRLRVCKLKQSAKACLPCIYFACCRSCYPVWGWLPQVQHPQQHLLGCRVGCLATLATASEISAFGDDSGCRSAAACSAVLSFPVKCN